MKSKILIFLLALVSVSAFGQLTKVQDLEIQKGIRFVGRSDSTTISNVGQIQFDADDDKFRFNDGTGWFSFLKEGASLPYLPLITGGNNFDVEGTGTLRFGNPDLLDDALSGIWLEIGNDGLFGDYVSVKSDLGEIVNINAFAGVKITGTIDATEIKEGGVDIGKTYIDGHLGGLTLPAGSTATQNQLIRKGSTNFEYFTPSGSGITYSSGNWNLGGTLTGPTQLLGSVPLTFGSSSSILDSLAIHTQKFDILLGGKSLTFDSDGIVYTSNDNLIYYADDYTSRESFTINALSPKKYVDDRVATRMPLSGEVSLSSDLTINGLGTQRYASFGRSGTSPMLSVSGDFDTYPFKALGRGIDIFTVKAQSINGNVLAHVDVFGALAADSIQLRNAETLDTAAWVLVRENSTGQIKKRSVSSIVSSGAFWPLTGTATLTGNVTINGGGTRDLSFGSSGSRLDELSLYADNQALINVASGNNVNRVTLQPGLSSFTLLDTDGMTLDVQILVQPGEADILRIVKDESVTVFEINADGSIVYGAPPTNCTGHATNTIWSDGGTLKLCP